jgi:hypothetical protein
MIAGEGNIDACLQIERRSVVGAQRRRAYLSIQRFYQFAYRLNPPSPAAAAPSVSNN